VKLNFDPHLIRIHCSSSSNLVIDGASTVICSLIGAIEFFVVPF
jgi:hypothetical protein